MAEEKGEGEGKGEAEDEGGQAGRAGGGQDTCGRVRAQGPRPPLPWSPQAQIRRLRGYGILTITNANTKSVSREETRPEKGNEKDEEEDDMVERKEEKEKEKEKGAEIFVFGGGNLESLMMVKEKEKKKEEAGKLVSY